MTAQAATESQGSTSSQIDDFKSEADAQEPVMRLRSLTPTAEMSQRLYVSGDAFLYEQKTSLASDAEAPLSALNPSLTDTTSKASDGGRAGLDQRPPQPFKVVSSALFPPLPLYGPPTFMSRGKALVLRTSSFFLSLIFLMFIVAASLITGMPLVIREITHALTGRDPRELRPFYEEERRRADLRREKEKLWDHRVSAANIGGDQEAFAGEFPPTEGGKDRMVCDVSYYAKRVGLDVDFFQVRTEDGFLIDLWHVYDPREYAKHKVRTSGDHGDKRSSPARPYTCKARKPKYPILLLHGLLQSSGTFCCSDDDSLAFWLCKSGFDVWLGNNRCGSKPSHESLRASDPRMWAWTIQHMGTLDLPALTSKVLAETGFEKLGLICHSQGTAQTLIALAKDQRPDLGDRISVFCALAPAAYAGPLISKYYFQFIHRLSPFWYRISFGVHAFIPFMMQMHELLDARVYGWLGYKVFSYLFGWSDARWDRGLRNRLFQFSPVYVSAETMRWWLGMDGFAKNSCILSAKTTAEYEEQSDTLRVQATVESIVRGNAAGGPNSNNAVTNRAPNVETPASDPWYNEKVPPFAMWVCANDQLVDGPRLLRRFERGREPHVQMVFSRVIEDYEHLDVIWAIDAVSEVFEDMREVLWKTCPDRERCRVPEGCQAVAAWKPKEKVA
ncbi:AB-hydrolase-associated lipase region [Moelleriella libera RCEF 2490]|uniref:AB-hydrolase-associated lipase region n=1 Tax=Moelleriella libera RCEF 2490 TaxID=1081109 RepID=A0A167XWL2_9HYPO|nr:AB-hydrolase-associated lipase region [Moelleriella libera RCEF 2490]